MQNNNFSSHILNFLLFFFFKKIFIWITVILTLFTFFLFREFFIFVLGLFCLFSFSSLERFWYFSRASFWSFSLFCFIIFMKHFHTFIQKLIKNFLIVINHFLYIQKNIFIVSKISFEMWVILVLVFFRHNFIYHNFPLQNFLHYNFLYQN